MVKPGLLFSVGLYLAMVVGGSSMYLYLAAHTSHVRKAAAVPTKVKPIPPIHLVPGTLYMAQGGAIYSLKQGNFKQITPAEGWSQPVVLPNGAGLLAVKRSFSWSDLYQLSLDGKPVAQLTHNAMPNKYADVGTNHWIFYPRLSPDGQTVFLSYDSGKSYDYEVDLAVWQIPLNGARSGWREWTFPNNYTGGDVQPLPTAAGGLIYTKYDYDDQGKIAAQVWLKPSRLAQAKALTTFADDCSQPALSPDGAMLAMVCTHEQQQTQLVLADFNGSTISNQRTILTDQLLAQPAFAPDGSGIAYLAPAESNQPFQLWWLPKSGYVAPAPSPTPSPKPSASPSAKASPKAGGSPAPAATPVPPPVPEPLQVTAELAIDATSPFSWAP